jgi:outer membrane biosynthesis protein TonB
MARLSASLLALALGAVVALGLVACGSGGGADLLPGDTANEINSNLDRVQELVGEEECAGAEEAAQEVSAQVEALGGVDEQLKQALREGATRLTLLVEECEETTSEETTPAIEPAEELQEVEKEKKPDKPEKPKKEAPEATATIPELPPQAKGKAKGHEQSEEAVPPVESDGGTSSGGVAPATPAGSE